MNIKQAIVDWCDRVLVEDWRRSWRWISMRAMALNMAFLMTWATVPDDLKTGLPSWILPVVLGFVLVVGMAGRVTYQKPPDSEGLGK